jgi:alpha-D-ribose 1-methylphosphonate 5-triphosphate synthase subunit PhnG
MPQTAKDLQEMRRATMRVLTHAAREDIAGRLAGLGIPQHERLRPAEHGLVMLRGRIGGDGAPFNLGEATVSRAAVRLATGEIGHGYVLGRDGAKAELIALCDALVQTAAAEEIQREVIAPLSLDLAAERRARAEETAATRVDFFTMVRGEN